MVCSAPLDCARSTHNLGTMDTLRVFVVARASFRLPKTATAHAADAAADGSSAAASASASRQTSSFEVLTRVCDGLMHALQPLTPLLVEVIPMRMPIEVLDHRCFLQQASCFNSFMSNYQLLERERADAFAVRRGCELCAAGPSVLG